MVKDVLVREPTRLSDTRSPLLDSTIFTDMWRLAEAMAKAKTLPEHLRGNPGDCLRVVEYAHRCGYSPFALADSTFLVGGKMGWDGKAVAAMVNASPRVQGSLRYAYDGEGTHRRVIVSGRLAGESEDRTVEATKAMGLRDSKGARNRWEVDEDQMLAFYGARRWARRHTPEIILGIYTADELLAGTDSREMIDITPPAPGPTEAHVIGHAADPHADAPPAPTNGKTPLVMLDSDGRPIDEYPTAGQWLDYLEAAAVEQPGYPGLVTANWELLTRIAMSDKAPAALRARAEALREAYGQPAEDR